MKTKAELQADEQQNANPRTSLARKASDNGATPQFKLEQADLNSQLRLMGRSQPEVTQYSANNNNDTSAPTTPKPDSPASDELSQEINGSSFESEKADYQVADQGDKGKEDAIPAPVKFKPGKNFIEITALDMANDTAAQLINLYQRISGQRTQSYLAAENLDILTDSELRDARKHSDNVYILGYSLTMSILTRQYQEGMKSLISRSEFKKDKNAALILAEIKRGIQKQQESILSKIRECNVNELLSYDLSAYNITKIWTEAKQLIAKAKSDEISSKIEAIEGKISFLNNKFQLILTRLQSLATEVPRAADLLEKFMTSIPKGHIAKLKSWDNTKLDKYVNFWTMDVACTELTKILHSDEPLLNLATDLYVQNETKCQFSPLMRACFAFVAIHQVTLISPAIFPSIAKIKQLFSAYANKDFNIEHMEQVLSQCFAILSAELDSHQKYATSTPARMFPLQKQKTLVAIEQIQKLMKWINKTDLHHLLFTDLDFFLVTSPQTPNRRANKSGLNNSTSVSILSDSSLIMTPASPAMTPVAVHKAKDTELLASSSDGGSVDNEDDALPALEEMSSNEDSGEDSGPEHTKTVHDLW